ncbi:MAG: energy transducer TonB [Verrucomicrobia bacterium]|nr:energy transducer TonB [Verrucomicrobiota bacterium]
MKGEILFSICASVGLHVGGALLVPWPDGGRDAQDGVVQVTLEIVGAAATNEAPPALSEPSSETEIQTVPEPKAADSIVQAAPPVELKEEAPALMPVVESPPTGSQNTPIAAKTPSTAVASAEPAPKAKSAASATIRGGSSINISGVRYRERAALSYPISALRQRIGGTVLLLVNIDESGRATSISVQRSSGNADLDHAATTCARQSTYEPYRVHGVAQPCRVEAPFQFEASALRR